MSKYGNGFRCRTCGGTFPVTRRNLRSHKSKEGFQCVRCEQGKGGKKERPSRYG